MPAAITKESDITEIYWHNVARDLKENSGLSGLDIDFSSVTSSGFRGIYEQHPFEIKKIPECIMMIMSNNNEQLIAAYSEVIGYSASIMYKEPIGGQTKIEWNNLNPEQRYKSLKEQGKSGLVAIIPLHESGKKSGLVL